MPPAGLPTEGPYRPFPTTIWSDILAAGDPASPECRPRLELLIRTYWTPVYAYVRAAWHKSNEDAKDLTQAFFAHLLEKKYLSNVRPERGTFRGYLKQALRHFLIDADRASRSRRPDGPLLRLGESPDEIDRISPPSPGDTPEKAFDREWFRRLIDDAIGVLKERLAADGKSVYVDVFQAYCLDPVTRTGKTSILDG
jgi:RNA polymerase sigma-70 factor (ECF subfamily)